MVKWNDRRTPFFITKLDVASALTDSSKAELAERSDRLLPREDRQPVAHALSSSVAMIGGSISVGRGWSSK